jgi:hypothetical protein
MHSRLEDRVEDEQSLEARVREAIEEDAPAVVEAYTRHFVDDADSRHTATSGDVVVQLERTARGYCLYINEDPDQLGNIEVVRMSHDGQTWNVSHTQRIREDGYSANQVTLFPKFMADKLLDTFGPIPLS